MTLLTQSKMFHSTVLNITGCCLAVSHLCHFAQNNLTVEQIIFHANSNNETTERRTREKIEAKLRNVRLMPGSVCTHSRKKQGRHKDFNYSGGNWKVYGYCFMKQKFQIQMGIARYRNMSTQLSTRRINTTHQNFQMRYVSLFQLKGLKSYQLK